MHRGENGACVHPNSMTHERGKRPSSDAHGSMRRDASVSKCIHKDDRETKKQVYNSRAPGRHSQAAVFPRYNAEDPKHDEPNG